MSLRKIAQQLGRRGGLKRAKILSAEKRKKIAASGGRAKAESLLLAKRIEENFRYLETIRRLRPL